MHLPFRKILLVTDRRHRAFGLASLTLWLVALSFQASTVFRSDTAYNQLILWVLVALFLVTHLRLSALRHAHERGLRLTTDLLYSARYLNEIADVADTRIFLEDLRRCKEAAARLGTPSVVVSVALARMELIRNQFGDRVGSATVRGLAKALRRITNGDDRLAYVGEGRFAIMLVDCSVDQSTQFTRHIPSSVVVTDDGESITLNVEIRRYDVTNTAMEVLMAAVGDDFLLPYPAAAAPEALPDAA